MSKRKVWEMLLGVSDEEAPEDGPAGGLADNDDEQKEFKVVPASMVPALGGSWIRRVQFALSRLYTTTTVEPHSFVVHSGCAGSGCPMIALEAGLARTSIVVWALAVFLLSEATSLFSELPGQGHPMPECCCQRCKVVLLNISFGVWGVLVALKSSYCCNVLLVPLGQNRELFGAKPESCGEVATRFSDSLLNSSLGRRPQRNCSNRCGKPRNSKAFLAKCWKRGQDRLILLILNCFSKTCPNLVQRKARDSSCKTPTMALRHLASSTLKQCPVIATSRRSRCCARASDSTTTRQLKTSLRISCAFGTVPSVSLQSHSFS